MVVVETRSLGHAWLEVSRRILADGRDTAYDGLTTKELALLTLVVDEPDPADGTDRLARRPGLARLDAAKLHRARRRRRTG